MTYTCHAQRKLMRLPVLIIASMNILYALAIVVIFYVPI